MAIIKGSRGCVILLHEIENMQIVINTDLIFIKSLLKMNSVSAAWRITLKKGFPLIDLCFFSAFPA